MAHKFDQTTTLANNQKPFDNLSPEKKGRLHEILNRSKRDPSEPPTIFLRHNDTLNNTEITYDKNNDQEINQTFSDPQEIVSVPVDTPDKAHTNKRYSDYVDSEHDQSRNIPQKRKAAEFVSYLRIPNYPEKERHSNRSPERQNVKITTKFKQFNKDDSEGNNSAEEPDEDEDEDEEEAVTSPPEPIKFNIPTEVQHNIKAQKPIKQSKYFDPSRPHGIGIYEPNVVIHINNKDNPSVIDLFKLYEHKICPTASSTQPTADNVKSILTTPRENLQNTQSPVTEELTTITGDPEEHPSTLGFVPLSSSNKKYTDVNLTDGDIVRASQNSTQTTEPVTTQSYETTTESVENRILGLTKDENDNLNPEQQQNTTNLALIQNAVKKVINNFVPGKSQDLIAKFGTKDNPELVDGVKETLLPEIQTTPKVKDLINLPQVKDMIIDKSGELVSEVTQEPITDKIRQLIKDTLEKIINEEIPLSTTASIEQDKDAPWLTSRENSLEKFEKGPPKEVFDKIKQIIKQSNLKKEAVTDPMIQNMIVKAVKHELDKERGVIDESTIRRAFRLIVNSKDKEYSGKTKRENQDYMENLTLGENENNLENNLMNSDFPDDTANSGLSEPMYVRLDHSRENEYEEAITNYEPSFTPSDVLPRNLATKPLKNDQIYLLVEGLQESEDSATAQHLYSYNPSKSQELTPAGTLVPVNLTDLPDLTDSKLAYVSNGMRLPLSIRQLEDGSSAITLSDEMCKQFSTRLCPCCIPGNYNGIIVRESPLSEETGPKMEYSGELGKK